LSRFCISAAERNAAGASGRVVDDDGLLAIGLGVIEDERRPELADGGGAHAGRAGGAHDRLLIEIIAGEMLVDVAKHRIAFQERGKAVAGAWHGKSGIERVAESPGVADLVPRRHRRGIGHGEGREHRVRIREVHALLHQPRERRRRLLVDHPGPQPVGNEQDDVMRLLLSKARRGGRGHDDGNCDTSEATAHIPSGDCSARAWARNTGWIVTS
jgi:hypothetical protein